MSKTLSTVLLEKSLEAMTMAIEIYNKPLVKYRTETCIILIINAWEHALKATIQKNGWAKLYDIKNEWFKPFEECLECVKAHKAGLSEDAYQSINLLYKKRCRVIHYHKSIEILDYMAIQSNIISFRDFVSKNFNRSIIKDKTWYILPLGIEIPFTQFDFISYSSATKDAPKDIKNYISEVISTQNSLISSKSKGILFNLNINLVNVKRIDDADMKVAIDGESGSSVSLDGLLKISEQGKTVKLTNEQFSAMQEAYPLSYADVLKKCKQKRVISQQVLQTYIDKCKNNQNLSINWKLVAKSLDLPFTVPNKYMYKQKVVDDF